MLVGKYLQLFDMIGTIDKEITTVEGKNCLYLHVFRDCNCDSICEVHWQIVVSIHKVFNPLGIVSRCFAVVLGACSCGIRS